MQTAVQPGTILLGKYRVERVLGQGGMGFVVAARHVHLGELFAMKLMLPEALKHRDAMERFLREARAAARLKGEHVARVHDVGHLETGAPYMLMEHLVGEDLEHILEKRTVLPYHEAVLYLLQACEAVAEAHAIGIVHRDLKPANLFLISRPNGTPCVKVLDFGISKELNPANNIRPNLTKTGSFIGSPLYMSPEQMENAKSANTRSDIWSLGIILYELITGRAPFVAEVMTELVTKVLKTQPVPPRQLHPEIPAELDAIVLRCLEKQPEDRFSSVRELMAALQPFSTATSTHTDASVAPKSPSPRPDLGADTTTVALPKRAVEKQVKRLSATELPDSVTLPREVGRTGGAWGSSSKIATRKDLTSLIVGLIIGTVALFVVKVVITRSQSTAPTNEANIATSKPSLAILDTPKGDASVSAVAVNPSTPGTDNSVIPAASATIGTLLVPTNTPLPSSIGSVAPPGSPTTTSSSPAASNATAQIPHGRPSTSDETIPSASGTPMPGKVRVSAKPGYCFVVIAGAPQGATPIELSLSPGTYDIKCKVPSGSFVSQSVIIKAGETNRVLFAL